MYRACISGNQKPDDTPYDVIEPTQDIGATNGAQAPLAHTSNALPWSYQDAVPQEISDATLWAAVHGSSVPPPPPGPNASATERARAVLVRKLLA
jgi:hypothetical protein